MCLRFLALASFSKHLLSSFVFHLVSRTQPLLLSFRVFSPIICYRSLTPFHPPLTLCYRPPTFVYSFHSRTLVFPSCTSYQTPRTLRVTRLGPPEKVDSVNRAHGNRACPYSRYFAPTLSNPSFPQLSLSILLSRHTTLPCTHPQSAITRM